MSRNIEKFPKAVEIIEKAKAAGIEVKPMTRKVYRYDENGSYGRCEEEYGVEIGPLNYYDEARLSYALVTSDDGSSWKVWRSDGLYGGWNDHWNIRHYDVERDLARTIANGLPEEEAA